MRPRDRSRAEVLRDKIELFSDTQLELPGVSKPDEMTAFVEQLVDSIRRVEYVERLAISNPSPRRASPEDEIFDPLRAAVIQRRAGDTDEACWLVFLAVHFGWHPVTRWRLVADVYGALGSVAPWTWPKICADVHGFRHWLADNAAAIRAQDIPRRFGNHRKYLGLDAWSGTQTGAAVASYVEWVVQYGNHAGLFAAAEAEAGSDRGPRFDWLYRGMSQVASFGRIARFDYLCMLRKLGLLDIAPCRPYLSGATGPLEGARRLLQGTIGAKRSPAQLDKIIAELARYIDVDMQVIEDAICNWNKNPDQIRHYRI